MPSDVACPIRRRSRSWPRAAADMTLFRKPCGRLSGDGGGCKCCVDQAGGPLAQHANLGYMPEHKRKRIAQETLDIFAPLANRLGIWQVKWELEDLGFRYVNPDMYREIAASLDAKRTQRDHEMNEIKKQLTKVLSEAGIQIDVSTRSKHIYSIYKKMSRKGVSFDMVYDVRGVRIIVPEYTILLFSAGGDPYALETDSRRI